MNIAIFDLDGTLSNPDHRLHLRQTDRDQFAKQSLYDTPLPNIRLLQDLARVGWRIWIWTGRSVIAQQETLTWLAQHDIAQCLDTRQPGMVLRMRQVGDKRKDHIIKLEWWNSLSDQDKQKVKFIFEDRGSVVDMWRAQGLTCLQVAPGDF